MFSKNNFKYILILALGFFWCSSVYLSQEQYLISYASTNFINVAEMLLGSISMALGILFFALLYKKAKRLKLCYLIFTIIATLSMCLFFFIKNKYVLAALMCATCFFGTAGFGAGYHFYLLGNVKEEYRGRVFAIGYGLGSVGTYLIVLLPERVYTSYLSLLIYVPIVIINIFILMRYTFNNIKTNRIDKKAFKSFGALTIIVLLMALLSGLCTDVIAIKTINVSGGYGDTRLYYCAGLLLAGFFADKHYKLFEVSVISSFIFSLLSIILLSLGYSTYLIAALSYFFVSFFVVYRTISFVNFADNNRVLYMSAFGLMYSRIMEGLLVLFEDYLVDNSTILIIVIVICLAVLIFVYFGLFYQKKEVTKEDMIKRLMIQYKLSIQESKVLEHLVDGKSNQEIADILFISLYTVKRHVASIYKKTNMKKKDLIEKCFEGTI